MQSKIKTYEDACKYLKRNPKALPEVKKLSKKEGEYLINHHKLIVITEAINKEVNGGKKWTPDYTDGSYKYFPWFYVKADKKRKGGFGLSYTFCDTWYAHSDVGSRLVFKTSDAALYSAKQFEKMHIINQLIK